MESRKFIAIGRSRALIDQLVRQREDAQRERLKWANDRGKGIFSNTYIGSDHGVLGLPWPKRRTPPAGWVISRDLAHLAPKGGQVVIPDRKTKAGRAIAKAMNALPTPKGSMEFTNELEAVAAPGVADRPIQFSTTGDGKLSWTWFERLFDADPERGRDAIYIIHVPEEAPGTPPDAWTLPNSAYHAMLETAIRNPGEALQEAERLCRQRIPK